MFSLADNVSQVVSVELIEWELKREEIITVMVNIMWKHSEVYLGFSFLDKKGDETGNQKGHAKIDENSQK